ncbi:hypothetical protein [Endothiovibrio diazotrophicus]
MNWRFTPLLVVLLFAGNGFAAPPLREKALVEPAVVTAAIQLEKELNGREGVDVPPGESWFRVIRGTAPVVITAPHATRPWREGERRFSDGGGTAALAVALAEHTGAWVIHTTYEGPSDPNYYDDNAFKMALAKVIEEVHPKLLLDLHGSHPYRSYDVDFGIMGGESLLGHKKLLEGLETRLRNDGLLSLSYDRFPAAKHQTLTKFAAAHGVPAIQLEINATWVTPSAGNLEAQRFSRLLQALERYVDGVVKP